MPVVDVNTVEHKATAVRFGARAGVFSNSIESSAGGKRGKFNLRKSGLEPDSQSERAETGVHQSPMKVSYGTKMEPGTGRKYPAGP